MSPQGYVLGPLLYVLFTTDILQIVARRGLNIHQYADDIQIYINTSVGDAAKAVDRLTACLSGRRRSLFESQSVPTESNQDTGHVAGFKLPACHPSPVQDTARDLGVVVDSRLSHSGHLAPICRRQLPTQTVPYDRRRRMLAEY